MSVLNDASQVHQTFTARATLVAIGIKVQQLGLLQPIFQKVRIAQKTVKFSPAEKLVEALITILAGAHGLVEANKRVRPDRGLQRAFGRSGCAEQSVIQDTLDACTSENVKQMEEALAVIYRQYSQGYRHPYDSNIRFWILTSPAGRVGRRPPSPPLAISAGNEIAGDVRSDMW